MTQKGRTSDRAGAEARMRRVVGNALIALVLLFTAYLSAVMLRRIDTVVLKDTYRSIFRHELALCGGLLLYALDVRFGLFTRPRARLLKLAGWVLRAAVVAMTLIIAFFSCRAVVGSMIDTAGEAENAIVLGMALEDGRPTDDLLLRLDAARQYHEAHPDATLILTGGNPDGAGLTEAAAMRALLAERGVPEERMVLEDRARTTRENFLNTARLLDPDAPVVLITSNYHMDRAVNTARSAGFTHVMRLPAPSSPMYYGVNVMWEVLMDIDNCLPRKQ